MFALTSTPEICCCHSNLAAYDAGEYVCISRRFGSLRSVRAQERCIGITDARPGKGTCYVILLDSEFLGWDCGSLMTILCEAKRNEDALVSKPNEEKLCSTCG